MTRPWRPLLDGAAAAEANRAIDAIAARLIVAGESDAALPLDGAAGRALFLTYLAMARPGGDWSALADGNLRTAVSALAERQYDDGLHIGFTSVAWVSQHLVGRHLDHDDADPNQELDEALLTLVSQSPWLGEFDLMRGLTGFGMYALERLPRPVARAILVQVIARLDELATKDGDGIAWHSRPELMSERERALYPRGNYNLGVAHGVPSVVTLLAAADAAGFSQARPLLEGAVRWLLAQRRDDQQSAFPLVIVDGERQGPARMAWCYGDPGIAAALLAAARATEDQRLVEVALDLGRRVAARVLGGELADAGIRNAWICHGSAGVALLLQRLWHDCNDERMARAARRLYGHAVECALAPTSDSIAFLNGACGLGLALLAAVAPVEPEWDRLLAASTDVVR